MGEEAISGSYLAIFEQKSESLTPMLFGVSCAFFALGFLSEPNTNDEKWLESRNKILQGSANLLGLLVWRVQREEANSIKREFLYKLENAERELEELKRRRTEDSKANEKVVSIFAAHEQGWFTERRKLRQHIGALLNELRILEKRKDEVITKLNEQLQEKELLLQSKDNSLKEGMQKNLELEEKLKRAESVAENLTETAKRVAQEHSAELWKHKTAFIELVSTQRQLEAEMGRAVRQVEVAKQQLDSVLEQKEQSILMTQKLSMELMKTRKDLEQKDNILSAMLRKSKLDTEEKQMLLKEVKLSKTKRKQAELETERWRAVSESRLERHSLRSMLSKHAKSKLEASLGGMGMHSNAAAAPSVAKTRSMITEIECEQPELQDDHKDFSPLSEQYKTYKTSGTEELDVKQLEDWVRSEAEKYATAFEQRHRLEIDAFTEQLRLKDEKLGSFRWRSLSVELELKRFQTHIEGLNQELSHLRQDNLKLEALLLDREAELHSLKERLALQLKPINLQKANLKSSSHDLAITHNTIWSKVKIVNRKQGEKELETTYFEISQEAETKKEEEAQIKDQSKDIVLMVPSPNKDFQEEKVVTLDPGSIKEECASSVMVIYDEKLTSTSQSLSKKIDNPWKMDLHALGVSYKIKRLTQQLLMFERLVGKQESNEDSESNDNGHFGIKGFNVLMSFLNKQVTRYLSLQGKTDDLCKRMHENDINVTGASPSVARKKEETKTLEHFLNETFQLQRYIVATGQKLMEIQSKIASGFVGAAEQLDGPASFDMQRFAESLRTLFREVQRGLEVRIARIIGDLEGTLACEGMIQLRK